MDNAQMYLQPGSGEKAGSMAAAKSVAQAAYTSANSNQEEYQTVARRLGRERLEDMAVIVAGVDYHDAYRDVREHGNGILSYSMEKGQGAGLDANGQGIVDAINKSSPVPVDLDYLKKNAGSIYSASSLDGSQIIIPVPKADGTADLVKTGIAIKPEEGKASLLQQIGDFNASYKRQDVNFRHLTTEADANEQTLISLNSVRTGNYKSLDARLKLTERYNAHMFAQGGYENPADPVMIRNFSGRKEEIERLKNAVDEHGNSIFTASELAQLDECVAMNGFGTEQGRFGMMARDATRRSRQRIARKALDEYQGEALGQAQRATATVRRVSRLNNEIQGLAGEVRAARVDKKINKLLKERDEIAGKNPASYRLKKLNRRLDEEGKNLGASKGASSSELRKRASAAQDRAREIRQARRDLNRATRGLGRAERKEVLMRLRMEDALARSNSVKAERLAAGHAKLSDKITRTQDRKRALKRALGGTKKKAAGKAAGKGAGTAGKAVNGIQKAISGLLKKLIAAAAPAVGAVLLVVCCAGAIVASVFLLVLTFFPDFSNREDNVLQSVNKSMNAHEAEQLLALQARLEEVVKKTDTYENPETISGRPVDSMCWKKDGRMGPGSGSGNGWILYHGTSYPIEGNYVRRRVRVGRKNASGRMVYSYETRWCEIMPDADNDCYTFYLRYWDSGSRSYKYTNYVWVPGTGEKMLHLNNTGIALPSISRSVKAGSAWGPSVSSTERYVWVNFGDTNDDGEDDYGWTELKDYGNGNRACYYVKFTLPKTWFLGSSTPVFYCMNFRSDGRLERQALQEQLSWEDNDEKIRPGIDMDYNVLDEHDNDSRICNCMQCMTLYRYYYHWTDEGQEDGELGLDAEDALSDYVFEGNYKNKMMQAWDMTHSIKATKKRLFGLLGTEQKYMSWKEALKNLSEEDIELKDGLPALDGSGRRSFHTDAEVARNQCDHVCYYYAARQTDEGPDGEKILDIVGPFCSGHYRGVVDVVVIQDMENIATKNILEGHFGVNINYEKFPDEEKQDIADLIGTYNDGFAEGFDNWADFEVYFGPARNIWAEADIAELMEKAEKTGRMSPRAAAFLRNALEGCGRFTYQRNANELPDWEVKAGFADSAGYVNWARNKTIGTVERGGFSGISTKTVDDWARAATRRFATTSRSTGALVPADSRILNLLMPGTVLIRGEPGSEDNRIAIWTGVFTDGPKDSYGNGRPVVIECIPDTVNGSVAHENMDVYNWKYYIQPSDSRF